MFPKCVPKRTHNSSEGWWVGRSIVIAALATCAALGVHAAGRIAAALSSDTPTARVQDVAAATSTRGSVSPPAPAKLRAEVLSSDDWLNGIKSEKYWAARRSTGSSSSGGGSTGASSVRIGAPPMGLGASGWGGGRGSSARDDDDFADGTYRTVCVRLCDGYFFPISGSASPEDFGDHEAICRRQCGSPAKLYVYKNGSEEPGDMVDLKGQPYRRLTTAFLYRTTYDASCKCKPHPWEQEATDRHRMFALQVEVKKGNRKASAELEGLKAKLAPQASQSGKVTERKGQSGKSGAKKTAAKHQPAPAGVKADGEDWGGSGGKASVMATAAVPVASAAPAKAGVKVVRLTTANGGGSQAGPSKVKITSQGEDWRKSAFSTR